MGCPADRRPARPPSPPEAAPVVLGHRQTDATQVYAQRDTSLTTNVVRRIVIGSSRRADTASCVLAAEIQTTRRSTVCRPASWSRSCWNSKRPVWWPARGAQPEGRCAASRRRFWRRRTAPYCPMRPRQPFSRLSARPRSVAPERVVGAGCTLLRTIPLIGPTIGHVSAHLWRRAGASTRDG